MKCYKCGATLSKSDKCPQCGADVKIYKEAIKASNAYYNLGLAKAKTRDLSGAVESLRTCIMIHKQHINARNLLGLVYYEMGDVVEALSEWVLSKNLQPEDNAAGAYIAQIQSNQGKFDALNQNVKKYNLALNYAKEGNYDMAVIQLKKIVGQNPKFIKAAQLLALLYMRDKEYTRARKLLNGILKVDRNNTLAHLYLKDIEHDLSIRKKESSQNFLPQKRERKTLEKAPLSGNDVIMPRSSYKEPSNGAITIINVLIGVAIGAALIWFLVMPSRYKGITADYNASLADYSEQLSSGNVEINALTQKVDQVTKDKERLEEQLADLNGTGGANKLLMSVIRAANAYIANDTTQAAEALLDVDVSSLPSEDAKKLYTTLSEATMKNAAGEFYNRGNAAYGQKNYETAAKEFENSYKCDNTRAEAAYFAAKSYEALGNIEEAKTYFQYIIESFATSRYIGEAQNFVNAH